MRQDLKIRTIMTGNYGSRTIILIELLNLEMFHQKLNYIHYNPVEAGFVEKEEDYLYSSARDFYDKKGLIELCYIV